MYKSTDDVELKVHILLISCRSPSLSVLSSKAMSITSFLCIHLEKQFSTGVLQEFLKHVIPDHLVRGTDLFILGCQIKNENIEHKNSCLV